MDYYAVNLLVIYAMVFTFIVSAYLILLNICKFKFTIAECLLAIILTFIPLAALLWIVRNVDSAYLIVHVAAGPTVAICMMIVVSRKAKNKILIGYYSTLAIVIHHLIYPLTSYPTNIIMTLVGASNPSPSSWTFWAIQGSFIISSIVLCYVVSRYIGHRLDKYCAPLSSEMKYRFSKHSLSLSLSAYLLFHVNIFAQLIGLWALVVLSNMLLLSAIFLTAILMMASNAFSQQKQAEADFKTKAEQELADHTRQLGQAYNNMRSFRHDYRNLLSALMGYDNMEELKSNLSKHLGYADDALKNLDSVEGRLNLINIPELKGLLWVKCAQAQTQGIDVELDIAEPLYDISLNTEDLCRMTGIVIDNAIEELMANDYNPKILKLSIVADEGDIIIDCSNPCQTAPLIKKIFDKGYSTKGPGRGLGLYNLKKIREKNLNVSYTVCMADGEFAIIIVVRRE